MKYSEINRMIEENKTEELVNSDEKHFKKQIISLVSDIKEQGDRLVMVAGPTSAGKTTFGRILSNALEDCGYKTLVISLDDYFFDRSYMKKHRPGVDFESVLSLDLELFKENISDILKEKKVELPRFSFLTAKREKKRVPFTPEGELIIFVEGIHALSKSVLSAVEDVKSLKVFICPQSKIILSSGARLNGTDMRLIRRTVRDFKFRNADATRTLYLWEDVRKSELSYIIPSAKKADVIIDSCFNYELPVLKTEAIRLLSMVSKESPHKARATRLINILKQFKELPESVVPDGSLLEEFIGSNHPR